MTPLAHPKDWSQWVSASATRNYVLRNPLVDWLNLYGEEAGFVRDTDHLGYDERLEFVPFLMRKGQEFEAAITTYLGSLASMVTIAEQRDDIQDPAAAAQTFSKLSDGQPIVHQAVLHDPTTQTYGAADFLIRSDIFADLFPGHLPPSEVSIIAPKLGGAWHYIVVDVKFTNLRLLVSDQVENGGSSLAYKAQVYIYSQALGRLQGYTPPTAFLLGRGWEKTVKRVTYRGTNAMDLLGPVQMSGDVATEVKAACNWLQKVRANGRNWSPLPHPTVPELWPNAKEESFPWGTATKQIASELNELTQLWYVGPDKRDQAHRHGITAWNDPNASATILGTTGKTTEPTLQAILDMNRSADGNPVGPSRVCAAEAEWRPAADAEFFVDFETVSNIDDDFTRIPEQNGQTLIFMIGCGHLQNGEWLFRSFTVDQLTEECEAEVIDEWLAHMAEIRLSSGSKTPRIIHWSPAEPQHYEQAHDSARERHPKKAWPRLVWFDLWARVIRKEPVVVRGALDFGLKSCAKAMHSRGLIETSWGDTKVDGLGAMTGAWWCNKATEATGPRLIDVDLMQEIARYNEVDCRVMMEIIQYLRKHH